MFEQIFSAQQRGWSVVVPDHNGADAPHQHMQQLWQKLLRPSSFTKLLMVGHSYGGPVGLSLFKSEPEACDRLGAVVTTDGMAWGVGGWGSNQTSTRLQTTINNLLTATKLQDCKITSYKYQTA